MSETRTHSTGAARTHLRRALPSSFLCLSAPSERPLAPASRASISASRPVFFGGAAFSSVAGASTAGAASVSAMARRLVWSGGVGREATGAFLLTAAWGCATLIVL